MIVHSPTWFRLRWLRRVIRAHRLSLYALFSEVVVCLKLDNVGQSTTWWKLVEILSGLLQLVHISLPSSIPRDSLTVADTDLYRIHWCSGIWSISPCRSFLWIMSSRLFSFLFFHFDFGLKLLCGNKLNSAKLSFSATWQFCWLSTLILWLRHVTLSAVFRKCTAFYSWLSNHSLKIVTGLFMCLIAVGCHSR